MTGYVIFAHGSTVETANEAVRVVAAEAARVAGFSVYETAYLDCAHPTLAEAVATLAGRGAAEIVIIPYFLTLGIHLQRDLPALVRDLEQQNLGVRVSVTPPLDGHPALSGIIVDRAKQAAARQGADATFA